MPKKIILKNGKEYGHFYGNIGWDKNKNELDFNDDEILEIVKDNTLNIGDKIIDYTTGDVGTIISKRFSDWSLGLKYKAEFGSGRKEEFSSGYGYYKLYD